MTLGEVLAAKRGERGLTIQQAASATRIQADYLKALEAGHIDLCRRAPGRCFGQRSVKSGLLVANFTLGED